MSLCHCSQSPKNAGFRSKDACGTYQYVHFHLSRCGCCQSQQNGGGNQRQFHCRRKLPNLHAMVGKTTESPPIFPINQWKRRTNAKIGFEKTLKRKNLHDWQEINMILFSVTFLIFLTQPLRLKKPVRHTGAETNFLSRNSLEFDV